MKMESNDTLAQMRDTLARMRKQGLDEKGQPISSYWKARIETEEGRVRVLELEEEIRHLRSQAKNTTQPPNLEKELLALKRENEKLKTNSQATDLKVALAEMESSKRAAALKFQEHIGNLQKKISEMHKENQELVRSRDHWKSESAKLRKSLEDLDSAKVSTTEEEVTPLGHIPTIQDFLLWMGVRLTDGRVLAVGEDSGVRLSIEVKEGSLHRMNEVSPGVRKSFRTVSLLDPVPTMISLFLPYRSYFEYQTDPRILEVFRVLGRPLTLGYVDVL